MRWADLTLLFRAFHSFTLFQSCCLPLKPLSQSKRGSAEAAGTSIAHGILAPKSDSRIADIIDIWGVPIGYFRGEAGPKMQAFDRRCLVHMPNCAHVDVAMLLLLWKSVASTSLMILLQHSINPCQAPPLQSYLIFSPLHVCGAGSYQATHTFTNFAHWLIPGHVLLGGYPYMQPTKCLSRVQGDRQLKQLVNEEGIDVFVCLQQEIPAQVRQLDENGVK